MNQQKSPAKGTVVFTKTRAIITLAVLLVLSVVETEFVKADRDAALAECSAPATEVVTAKEE